MRGFFRRSSSENRPGDRRTGFQAPLLSTIVAVSIGTLVLLDLLTDIPLLNLVGTLLVDYGLIIAAFALILGLLNVLNVHSRKVRAREEGWFYSFLLLITVIALVALGSATGPEGSLMNWTLLHVLLPLQSTFFSLLAFFLLGVAYRAMRVNSIERLLFVASAILVILGATPAAAFLTPLLVDAREYLLAVPAAGGARGLLLGVALGTIATGLRLIFDSRHYFK